uniref:Uncharacterized protein n=1 Tax=Pseudomonas phage Drael01 TaxID=3138533 RepID=A0AAU6W1A5_9VIRU
MARHLYLIQRHIGGDNSGTPDSSIANTEWRDCGTACSTLPDAYGNEGYPSLQEARSAVAVLRDSQPYEAYRLIQIVQ